jgi:hypothetical protein
LIPSLDTNLIRTRAYHLWEQEGRPQGRELEHWQEAERQLGVEFQFGYPDGSPDGREGGDASSS